MEYKNTGNIVITPLDENKNPDYTRSIVTNLKPSNLNTITTQPIYNVSIDDTVKIVAELEISGSKIGLIEIMHQFDAAADWLQKNVPALKQVSESNRYFSKYIEAVLKKEDDEQIVDKED